MISVFFFLNFKNIIFKSTVWVLEYGVNYNIKKKAISDILQFSSIDLFTEETTQQKLLKLKIVLHFFYYRLILSLDKTRGI